ATEHPAVQRLGEYPGRDRGDRHDEGGGEAPVDGEQGGSQGSRGDDARQRDQHGILLTGLLSTHGYPPGRAKVQRSLRLNLRAASRVPAGALDGGDRGTDREGHAW